MERRRYRRKKQIAAAMKDQVEASQEMDQTGGQEALKSTPGQERTPTITSPSAGNHSVPIIASLYDYCRFENQKNLSSRTEATPGPTAAGSQTQGTGVITTRDHVLLKVTAMIKGTPLCALVDSGATRSFID